MGSVFDLFAKLTLDSTEYEKGLGDSEEKAKSFGSGLKTALGTAGAVAATGIAAVTTAAVATGTALVKGTGEIAAYGDNIDKMSQKMGMSAQAYQEWDAIMQHSGTSIEAMQASMKTLATAAETNNKAFAELGITEEELASLNQEDLFARTIEALQNVESDTQRTYLAGKLLGRGATELGALLNTSAEDTEAMRQRVHELGGVMSDEAVKASAAYQDSLQDMSTAFSGLKRNLISEFLPGVKTTMDGLTEIFSGNTGGGLDIVSTGIDSIVSAMTERLPEFAEVGFGIIEALGTAIIDNIPQISDASVQIILKVVEFLIQSAPKLIDAAVEIIFALADGLVEALPNLIPAITEMIVTIAEKLTEPETLVNLVEAALAIIVALADGLLQAIPKLLEAVPEIIENLITALIGAIPQFVIAGYELLTALIKDGPKIILEILKFLPDLLISIVTGIIDGIPMIIDAGVELLTSIIEDLPTIISTVIKAIPEIVMGLVQALAENAGKIIESGAKLLASLAEGILEALPELLMLVPQIINGIVDGLFEGLATVYNTGKEILTSIKDGFMEGIEAAREWGSDLISNFIDGITDKVGDLWDKVKEIGQGIKDFLGFSEPKKGPLSNFHTFAPDMMKLFAQGIKDNEGLVTAQISRSFNFEPQLRGASPALAAGPTTNTFNITVNGIDELEEVVRWYQGRQVEGRMR